MRNRLARAIAAEEQAGLALAFRARAAAVLVVALWLPFLVPPPRLWYYLAVVATFLVLGIVPHLLRRHRHATSITFAFILFDVILVTTVIIIPPPGALDVGWPIQTRVRFSEYLYLLLLIVGSALSYSPMHVLWTGFCVIVVWAAGVLALYFLPDTLRYAAATAGIDPVPSGLALQIVLSPTYVGISMLQNQLVLTAIVTGLLAAVVSRSRTMLRRQTRAEVARADLARYVSPDLADAIIRAEQPFGAPSARVVAVLFADIVGFTSLLEHLSSERVVALLRSFHERSCRIVFDNGGTLDKYLGDGFLATFGALTDLPDASARAIRCALELQADMDRWNRKRAARGALPVRLALGVHCGRVVVGNVGTESRLEFTVVGDAVNVASRLERLTREHACRIAVSETCVAAARQWDRDLPCFDTIGAVRLPGREQPVAVQIWPPTRPRVTPTGSEPRPDENDELSPDAQLNGR